MKRTINGLIFTLFTLPVLAQDSDKEPERWYEVEIILFEQLKPVSTSPELWPLDIEHPDLSNTIDLLHSPSETQTPALPESVDETITAIESTQPIETDLSENETNEARDPYLDTPYLILPQQQYQLTDAYQKLVNSENYLPLVHVAWRQVIPPREQPDRIFMHDKLNDPIEEDTLDEVSAIGLDTEFTPPSSIELLAELAAEKNTETEIPEHNLSGIISLGLGRYIHVEADLLLYKPQLENAAVEDELALPVFSPPESMQFIFDDFEIEPMIIEEEQTPELFRIQGNLRMPSKEVHYLDHPLVGMLILFTPYEVPKPEITEELDNTSAEQTMPAEPINKGAIIRPGRVVEDRSF